MRRVRYGVGALYERTLPPLVECAVIDRTYKFLNNISRPGVDALYERTLSRPEGCAVIDRPTHFLKNLVTIRAPGSLRLCERR